MNSKNKKKLKIIGLIIMIITLVVGVFLIGKKWGEKNENPPPESKKNEQKSELERLLDRLEKELKKETNPDKKQELENEIKKTKQEIKKLGGSNNNNPSRTQKKFTVRYNTEVGGKHEYIDINNHKERILIDTKNKIFKTGGLTNQNSQYSISFIAEEAGKHKNGNWLFDQSNDKFQLTPITSPGNKNPSQNPNNNPNSDQAEMEINFSIAYNDYVMFSNNINGSWGKGEKNHTFIFISTKHPIWKGREWGVNTNDWWDKVPNFKISFLKKDASQYKKENTGWGWKENYHFDENNTKFTLTPLGNWPDENESPNQPPTKKKMFVRARYLHTISSSSNSYWFEKDGGAIFIIHKNHSKAQGVEIKEGYSYDITFELNSQLEILVEKGGWGFEENDNTIVSFEEAKGLF
ncbi:MAG: hypothetical protein I3273_07755 [Candidatus Moeniiplasma glomeromycotorum]|nr:hypothetical protein [Candidatus Moeniiplasma glomeromycotorum]MCE8168434.1 hypothetical protein [Candidatus Moeniiplasma glomeromycotorum]MCE8169974.1 hypothetical protein [Candidatus Moeniiplasma glomeromycotorum]